jgi:protein-disulfide isomerase
MYRRHTGRVEVPHCDLGGSLQLAILSYPIPSHPQARGAALAALCAENAGRLRQMHSTLLSSTGWRQDSNWVREALSVGIEDSDAFVSCISSPETQGRLATQMAWADSLRSIGTPTFVSRWS